jgi:hypothetical protein
MTSPELTFSGRTKPVEVTIPGKNLLSQHVTQAPVTDGHRDNPVHIPWTVSQAGSCDAALLQCDRHDLLGANVGR